MLLESIKELIDCNYYKNHVGEIYGLIWFFYSKCIEELLESIEELLESIEELLRRSWRRCVVDKLRLRLTHN